MKAMKRFSLYAALLSSLLPLQTLESQAAEPQGPYTYCVSNPDDPICTGAPAIADDVTADRLVNSDKEPNNWLSYHGGYKSWHYSALDQVNTSTVGKLQEAWSHAASRANRGLQGFPLAIDGVVYYSSPYNPAGLKPVERLNLR
jgi:hypothetical protein